MKIPTAYIENELYNVSTIKKELLKKKQMGKMMKEATEKKKQLAEEAMAKEKARKDKEKLESEIESHERAKLLKELKEINTENAKYFDTSNITHPILYKTRDDLVENVVNKDKGKEIFKYLQTVIIDSQEKRNKEQITRLRFGNGGFKAAWFEPAVDGDPLKSKYRVLYCRPGGAIDSDMLILNPDFVCITIMAAKGVVDEGWSIIGSYLWHNIFDDALNDNEDFVRIYKSWHP